MKLLADRSGSIPWGTMLLILSIALGSMLWSPVALGDLSSEVMEAQGFWAGLWNLRVAVAIFLIFFMMVALMYLGRISALLALPIMAILFGMVSGVSRDEIVADIIAEGSLRLHKTYTVAFFGGMLAIFVKERRIAETVIKYTAELAGDKPLVVGLALLCVTSLLFISLGGLGAIIMVGTIILPIMLSLGAPAYVAGGIFLIGVSTGGSLNPGAWQFYIDALGVPQTTVQNFAVTVAACYILIGTVFTLVGLRKAQRRNFMAVYPRQKIIRPSTTRPLALFTPLVPIVLVIQMGQMMQILVEYQARLKPLALYLGLSAVVVTGLVFFLVWIQKRLSRTQATLREIADFARPLLTIAMVASWVFLVFSILPSGWLGSMKRVGDFWDNHFGAWEFIPAFVAALVFGLATTWKGYPIRAISGGVATLLVVWFLTNAGQLPEVIAGEGGALSTVSGFLKLNHFLPFALGLGVTLALSWDRRSIQILSKSLIEGAESVMPAVLLMIGIGMLLKAVAHPNVSGEIQPLLERVVPSTRLSYITVFAILAPLALYRGPLNMWGMGIGLAGVMLGLDRLTPAAIMGIFISVGALQGVCDPTNTHNVWIANYLGVDVLELTRKLIPFIWMLTLIALSIAAFQFVP